MIEQLIPLLSPLRVAVLKHSHHLHIGPELPHKDSVRYRAAGALSSLCVPAAVRRQRYPTVSLQYRHDDLSRDPVLYQSIHRGT